MAQTSIKYKNVLHKINEELRKKRKYENKKKREEKVLTLKNDQIKETYWLYNQETENKIMIRSILISF